MYSSRSGNGGDLKSVLGDGRFGGNGGETLDATVDFRNDLTVAPLIIFIP